MEKATIITTLDQVTTAKELVALVSWQGVSTKQEDICRMQDIIGHSTVEELNLLANDIGADGYPDNPKSTTFSGRRGTRDTFYHLLSVIWNWQDLLNFWNENTNPDHKALEEAKAELKKYEKWHIGDSSRIKELNDQIHEAADKWSEEYDKRTALEYQLKVKNQEIMQLKAKLYDLMVKENGAA